MGGPTPARMRAVPDRPVWLISGDGHVGPPAADYERYLDPGLRQAFSGWLDGHQWHFTPGRPESLQPRDLHQRFQAHDDFPAMQWDPAARLSEYDRSGIVAEVLFPDDQTMNEPPWGAGMAPPPFDQRYNPYLTRAGARAHNRWLAEFCSAHPNRLLGLTVVGTLEDVDQAVDEVSRAYDHGLRTGVLLPLSYDLPLYHHDRYEPLWELCSSLGLSIVVHASKGGPDWYGPTVETAFKIYITEFAWFAHRPLWCLLLGGVLEHHPNLHVVITEAGSSWVGQLLDRVDGRAERHGFDTGDLPSDLYRRQCYVVHSSYIRRDEVEPAALERSPNLLWGADTGHGEGMWPDVREGLRDLLHGLPEAAMRPFLCDAAVQAYRLDVATLTEVAERICPTSRELALT
ncbi:MAG: amidohydrolase family protein [Actinomycetota bacterium]|nr:amidohydrolase family protein [Actinomycetota bacterium]